MAHLFMLKPHFTKFNNNARQVRVDRKTYLLPKPFFVIATQNPQSQSETFLLPEPQLDRFMLRIPLGYLPVGYENRRI